MFGKASPFRRTFVIQCRPFQKLRIRSAEKLNLSPLQSFNANRGIKI